MFRRRSNPGRYLEWHGRHLRVVVRVPRGLTGVIGRTTLKENLNTDSVVAANTLKWPVIARMQERIAQARSGGAVLRSSKQLTEALRYRDLARAVDRCSPALGRHEADVDTRAAEIAKEHGDGVALAFRNIATGIVTPIAPLIDRWLRDIDVAPRTEPTYRRALGRFIEWGNTNNRAVHVEAINRRLAGEYVSGVLAEMVRASANRDLSALSGFWVWLDQRGYVTGDNPWSRQRFSKRSKDAREYKRPFTDGEVVTLLTGIVTQPLSDMCRVAALTGMRINEIAELRGGDVADGEIIVRKGKTEAAVRSIPIHPDIAAILTTRTNRKPATAYVFHELPTQRGTERSRAAPACQAFTYARRKLGVDERVEGVRESAIDFHSFRRWFDRKARDAFTRGARGFTPWTIAEVMGHSRQDMPLPMTMGLYPGPDSPAARRACVEAVRLPKELCRRGGARTQAAALASTTPSAAAYRPRVPRGRPASSSSR